MIILWDYLVLYYKILRVSIDQDFLSIVVSWCGILVDGCLNIWTFAEAVNLLTFPEVFCNRSLPEHDFLSFLCETVAWGIAVNDLEPVFVNWDFCYSLGNGFLFSDFFLLRENILELVLS